MTKPIDPGKEEIIHSQFAREVVEGLSAHPKKLSSKWFYDEQGDELFQQIMATPEYYLTDCELSIFRDNAADFLALAEGEPFDLVELGAGDGTKTQLLIAHFMEQNADFRYLPIDISQHALDGLSDTIKRRWPDLPLNPLQGDYFQALSDFPADENNVKRKKIVLFPGGNIGNFPPKGALGFLVKLNLRLAYGDVLVTGIDLKKDPARILAAYNDAQGATAAFNLNLLRRINRDLGGDFDLDHWKHWPTYDPITGATRSYVISTRQQSVQLAELQQTFEFEAWEAIDLEISQKYSLKEIEGLATKSGYTFLQHLLDDEEFFVNTVWRV
jgi:dimethylhistidine N-methyltransferase